MPVVHRQTSFDPVTTLSSSSQRTILFGSRIGTDALDQSSLNTRTGEVCQGKSQADLTTPQYNRTGSALHALKVMCLLGLWISGRTRSALSCLVVCHEESSLPWLSTHASASVVVYYFVSNIVEATGKFLPRPEETSFKVVLYTFSIC